MTRRPTVIAKCAITLDGYMDKAGDGGGFPVSSREDGEATGRLRIWADAILVGADTVRRDKPRLLARSDEARSVRVSSGRPPDPLKCVMTRSGNIDPDNPFFTAGESTKYVLGQDPELAAGNLAGLAGVRVVPGLKDLEDVASFLGEQGIARLLIEGGPQIIGQWLEADLVDEMRVAIAPIIMGRLGHGSLGHVSTSTAWGYQRMTVTGRRELGDTTVVFLRPPTRTHNPILPKVDEIALHELDSLVA
ncbi:RibD family protein [Asanoa iriomotensis]|uniref:Bacterial bifunctional deaminase-reductase C-terminal domain-containing protein n=1 Tax=Asanoa iriomotensis TaxID=234613 RepID=A0ABQ4C4U7_9ACTN|nr:RibD family protein [Asanoa iriomotensis]GIF57803.1 hypothetical protein Air01nite_38980 [Asanoa iriomotensis]